MSGLVSTAMEGDVAVVRLTGEQDLSLSHDLTDTLGRLIESSRDVVVDLGGTTFVDSSILRSLVEGARWADDASVGYVVYLPETEGTFAVRRVVELTGLEDAIPIVDNRAMALEVVRER